jgi:hypothetical protein
MAQVNWTVEFFSESPTTSCMVCFQKADELTLSLPMQIDHAFEGSFETVSRRSTALALHPLRRDIDYAAVLHLGRQQAGSFNHRQHSPPSPASAAPQPRGTARPRFREINNRPASRLRLSLNFDLDEVRRVMCRHMADHLA